MNKHNVILNIKYDRLVYIFNRYNYLKVTFNVKFKVVSLLIISIIKETSNYVILKKKKSFKLKFSFNAIIKETLNKTFVKDLALKKLLNIV